MTELYPLKLERTLSPRLWGGHKLQEFLSLPQPWPGPEPLGESWQVYAGNRVANGPLAGRTLAEIAEEYGVALLGNASVARYGSRMPLLAKFIDAEDELSIQVHPDDSFALTHEAATGHVGKAEAWLILDAQPGAHIIWGFERPVTQDEVRQAALDGSLETLVRYLPVKTGDVIYNPPGTVHAIGAGILLFEIQQSSDLTYRLYDYGRRDASGRTRELHLDKALAVADCTPGGHAKISPRPLRPGRTELVRTPHFVMERWEVRDGFLAATSTESLDLLTLAEGHVTLELAGEGMELRRGESLVLPAALGAYQLHGHASVLRCYVPV
ncbi:MAG TPA: type I phosphomannose isomerase catalytic subunit [Phycisphaeraceae bacterium]